MTGAHEKFRERLLNNLPGNGARVFTITVDEALGVIAEYFWMKGQIEGLKEGGELLKKQLENRK